jgi:hypothetical protein
MIRTGMRQTPPLTGRFEIQELADARRTLDALTATTAWPTLEQRSAVFDALARCSGEAAVAAVLATLL